MNMKRPPTERQREHWRTWKASRTPEQLEDLRAKHVKRRHEREANWTPAQRAKRKEQMKKAGKAWRAKQTPEQRAERRARRNPKTTALKQKAAE
jgi:hypothetical protein